MKKKPKEKMPVEFTKYLLDQIRRIRIEATTRKQPVALGAAGRDVLTTNPIHGKESYK